VRVEPVRTGLLVTLAPARYVLYEECLDTSSGWGHFDAVAGARWLLHELHLAGLLTLPTRGWLKRYEEQILERLRERATADAQRQRAEAETPQKEGRAPMASPRCIQGVGRPEAPLGREAGSRDEVGSFRVYRADLSGDDGLTVYGRRGDEPGTLSSPILVGAMKPERAALFFDARIHGWDGELAQHGSTSTRPLGRMTQLICADCGGRLFHVWATFERNDETVHLDDRLPGRTPDDLFTWFELDARCVACGWSKSVASVECA
jgi:hypothetical protein